MKVEARRFLRVVVHALWSNEGITPYYLTYQGTSLGTEYSTLHEPVDNGPASKQLAKLSSNRSAFGQ